MISADLWGCLGNQMFQIATTRSLAIDNNDTECFDISGHRLGLQGFCATKYKDNIYSKIVDEILNNPVPYNEREMFKYDKIKYISNIKLFGYFQTSKYFDHNEKEIKDLFSIPEDIKDKLLSFISKTNVDNKTTISLHVRRGDYLGYPDIHPFVGIGYINEAISKFIDCYIYVISDDINWCINNIKSNNNKLYFVDEFEDYEQLYLISLCEHNIISNSTFGWWGSYLNNNDNKIVIAPSIWYKRDNQDNLDIHTNYMTIIDNSKFINNDNIEIN